MALPQISNGQGAASVRSTLNGNFAKLLLMSDFIRMTLAERPAPEAALIGAKIYVTDLDGGQAQQCYDGLSWSNVGAPENAHRQLASLFAARGSGSYVGEVKRFSNVGNNLLYRGEWDGDRWAIHGGRQLVYSLTAPIVSTAGTTTTTINLPNVTIPGDLIAATSAIEIDFAALLANGVTPTARTLSMTHGGSAIMNDTGNLHRRVVGGRTIQGIGASSQVIFERSNGEYGAPVSANTDWQTGNKNFAADQVIAGSFAFTYATQGSAISATLAQFDVWVRGV